jgi:hypothetical protein
VFVQHGVSVSVVLDCGVVAGCLVKESGRVPACSSTENCRKYRGGGGSETGPLQVRKAYVVLQARASMLTQRFVAAVGELDADNVEVVLGHVPCLARQDCAGWFDFWCVNQLTRGLFQSCVTGCWCSNGVGVCDCCTSVIQTELVLRFITVYSYSGVFPYSGAPWYTGITDVMDAERCESQQRGTWLAC